MPFVYRQYVYSVATVTPTLDPAPSCGATCTEETCKSERQAARSSWYRSMRRVTS